MGPATCAPLSTSHGSRPGRIRPVDDDVDVSSRRISSGRPSSQLAAWLSGRRRLRCSGISAVYASAVNGALDDGRRGCTESWWDGLTGAVGVSGSVSAATSASTAVSRTEGFRQHAQDGQQEWDTRAAIKNHTESHELYTKMEMPTARYIHASNHGLSFQKASLMISSWTTTTSPLVPSKGGRGFCLR